MKKMADHIRKEMNDDLVRAIKNGDDLSANIDWEMIAWPPRPIIKKNEEDIKRICKTKGE